MWSFSKCLPQIFVKNQSGAPKGKVHKIYGWNEDAEMDKGQEKGG